jgi:hypothetical protein
MPKFVGLILAILTMLITLNATTQQRFANYRRHQGYQA